MVKVTTEPMLCWYCSSEICDRQGNGEWRVVSSTAIASHDDDAYPPRPVAVCIPCSETCGRCGLSAPFGTDPHEQRGGICMPH